MNVKLIQTMGSDLTVVNAARVSFAKESAYIHCAAGENCQCWGDETLDCDNYYQQLPERDVKLINYLAKHNHWTPFGHCAATFHISAPIFVARQLGKHQVGLVWNEVSRRYVDDEPMFYEPDVWRKRAPNKKQGSLDEEVPVNPAFLKVHMDACRNTYSKLLEMGVCPEQARMVLPQSMMTEWYWSGTLAAFSRVAKLRLKPDTQLETRLVAEQISEALAWHFPVSWEALSNA